MNKSIIKKLSNAIFGAYVTPLAFLSGVSRESEKAILRSAVKRISEKSYDYVNKIAIIT